MALDIIAEDIIAYLEQHERKELLRFVAVGSVDDGKSTLIGRLLHDTHGIYEDQLSAVQRASVRQGSAGGKIDFALLTDGLKAEREQGITIDVAYRYFSTSQRKFIIADTPGHVQYTRNMATGASTANVALILIDAEAGVLQQSRRHAFIASLLGIPHLLVCVNKLDLVDFRQDVFERIKRDFRVFSGRLRFRDVRFVPICATDGDNVVRPSGRMPWYRDQTVLSYLEAVPIAGDRNLEVLRYPVQYVIRPDHGYRAYAGQIVSGVVRVGDDVTLLPSRGRARVTAIDTFEGERDEAFAPMSVSIRLDRELDLSRGDMIVHTGNVPAVSKRFEADVVWMSEQPLDPSRSYFLKHAARTVRATVERVGGKIDLQLLENVPAVGLELNDIGRLLLCCNQALFFDRYDHNRQSGAFVLIDAISNNTVAAGMIREAVFDVAAPDSRHLERAVSDVERTARFGHAAALIGFVGDPCRAQTEVACALERALFDAGHAVVLIDVGALSDGTRSPALLADVAEQCLAAGMLTIFSTGLPRAADREQVRARLGEVLIELRVGGERGDLAGAIAVDGDDPAGASGHVVEALRGRGVLGSG